MNISKKVKFVKAKELVVVAPIVEKANVEKKNVIDQRVLNKPRNQSMVKFEARAKSLPQSVVRSDEDNWCIHQLLGKLH